MTNPATIPTSVETFNGTYTVNMTREQAEKEGNYSCIFGIDYKNLDQDENGILDQKEILKGIVKQETRNCFLSGGLVVAWAVNTGLAALIAPESAGLTVTACTLSSANVAIHACNFKDSYEKREQAQKYLDCNF